MARATRPRAKTKYYGEGSRPVLVPAKQAPNTVIFPLAMAALTADGLLVSASEPTALYAVGRAEKGINTAGALAPVTTEYRRGVFNWDSDGSLTQAHVGKKVAIADDQTVKVWADGAKLAGVLLYIDESGFWVESSPELAIMLNP